MGKPQSEASTGEGWNSPDLAPSRSSSKRKAPGSLPPSPPNLLRKRRRPDQYRLLQSPEPSPAKEARKSIRTVPVLLSPPTHPSIPPKDLASSLVSQTPEEQPHSFQYISCDRSFCASDTSEPRTLESRGTTSSVASHKRNSGGQSCRCEESIKNDTRRQRRNI